MTDLRPYQATAVESAIQALTTNGSAVLQMPTGAGKTVVATEIVGQVNKPVWFICHRQEIERQVADAFTLAGIDFGIVSPRYKPDCTKAVQIISVHSKWLEDLPLPYFVIWDECHHVPAPSWASLHKRLSSAKHLGLTATPERLDGKGLSDWFEELIVGPSIAELVEQGYLSPFRYFAPSDPDLASAKLQAGDYRKKDADAAMNTPVLIGDAVAEYRRVADGKRAIAFCTSVDASMALVGRFNAEGIPARHIDGTTGIDERKETIAAFEAGEVRVLSNVEVFTEGFDVPSIEAVILLRPTKSPTLLLQMIGRALRYVEGKTAVIMDHAGLHHDHGWFASEWDWNINGGAAKARRRGGARGPRRCPECKEVRAEREPMCACGYEFPTGREIGEYDGVLREVTPFERGAFSDLAKKYSIPALQVYSAHDSFKVDSRYADFETFIKERRPLWLVDPAMRKNYIRIAKFAKKVGRSPTTIMVYADKMGMPGVVPSVRYAGIPCYVNEHVASVWLEENKDKLRGFWTKDSISKHALSKKLDLSEKVMDRFIAGGMPYDAKNKRSSIKDAMKWIESNYPHLIDRSRYSSATSAGVLLGLNKETTMRMFRNWGDSIPRIVDPLNGKMIAVPIVDFLEWVRDNTNIKIPPEAWPTNDNQQAVVAA